MSGLSAPDGLRIRPVERADLLAVHRIERVSFEQPWPYDAFRRYLDSPGFQVAVDPTAESTGPIDAAPVVGFVVGDLSTAHGRTFGHIKDLAVHPAARRDGVGRRLLESALAQFGRRNVDSVKLEVRVGNDGALELYRSMGFEPLRRVGEYYDDGEDALVMVRQL